MRGQSVQFAAPPVSPVVKVLLSASAVLFLVQLICDRVWGVPLELFLGFVPARLLSGWIWQPFTYSFLHDGLYQLLFNLLVVWTVGSELEGLWGGRTFFAFYMVCAVGGALTHACFSLAGIGPGAVHAVIGSSGVVYGLLLAYGILFGERTMYFFMLFPIQARYFVLLLGAIELISSVFYGHDGVSHLAHLGGMAAGFFFLAAMAAWRRREREQSLLDPEARERRKRLKKAGHLKLVRGDDDDDDDEPKTWN
jgi:membrane associated rhomboid family serine protease